MHTLNAKFELFDSTLVAGVAWSKGMRQGSKLPGRGEISGIARKYKNSGNEAKKSLKTKDITFSHAANCTCFAGKTTAI